MGVDFGAIFRCDVVGCSKFYNLPPHSYKNAQEFIGVILTLMASEGWDINKDGAMVCPSCREIHENPFDHIKE
jgi:hypothetical protein